ncbi:MAG: cell division protein FtsZ [Ruminococcaceae bacterium]|nr:cell division protein FtsZ [Oscillospiraceae bacterium]
MTYDYDTGFDFGAVIKVIGVGGGGNNAVNRMVENDVKGVEFIAVNTDKQALLRCAAPTKILIGEKVTKGRGAGANPEVGLRAAEENIDDIKAALVDTDMVFITAGMGGGTGTGAAPAIAKVAKEMGILTIGVVTKPFAFEGPRKMAQAEAGIENLRKCVDSIIMIPNERLKFVSETRITLANAFQIADDVLRQGVQSITELINVSSFINLDFNDVGTVMREAGLAHMGVGMGQGKDKAELAAKAAISSPLLETSITGARGIIINITSSPDIGLEEVEYAANLISKEANPEANIIWGAAFDTNLEDEMKVTVVATGFEPEKKSFEARVARPVVAPVQEEAAEEAAAEEEASSEEVISESGIDDDISKIFSRPRSTTGSRFNF